MSALHSFLSSSSFVKKYAAAAPLLLLSTSMKMTPMINIVCWF